MRRSLTITGVIAAGLTALAVAATPALAAGVPADGRGAPPGSGRASSSMALQGLALPATGALTFDQKVALASMVEEEKLAGDVYVALAARFPTDVQFARIASAESQHVSALRTLLARYSLTDPTIGQPVGEFSTSAFRDLYTRLVAQATTAANALDVGVAVEKLDIADLTAAMDGVTAPDVLQTYANLRDASQQHLSAFGG